MTMVSDANAFIATAHEVKSDVPDFAPFAQAVERNYLNLPSDVPVFHTDVDLWEVYLGAFPEEHRQEHNCNCCKQFLRNVGSIVYINSNGIPRSILWDTQQDYGYFNPIVEALANAVEKAKIVGLYLNNYKSGGRHLGAEELGGWNHFYLTLADRHVEEKIGSRDKQCGEISERFKMVVNAVTKFDHSTVETVLGLAESGTLHRPEKVLGQLKWFYELGESFHGVAVRKGIHTRNNLIWRAVATAPVGFANICSGVSSALLEDIQNGVDTDTAVQKHNVKMRGDRYLRPTTHSAGNVKAANKLIEELGYERSFDRRFARLEDLELKWRPIPKANTAKVEAAGGMFDVLLKEDKPIRDARFGGTMTWARFEKDILGNAERIEVLVPSTGNFFAFTAPVHDDAPLIFQWDNGIGTYSYVNGSPSNRWNLEGCEWTTITGITNRPSHWGNTHQSNHADCMYFVIDGCVDRANDSMVIFPETLKSVLHPVRSTIEAFAKTRPLEGANEASACGLAISNGTMGIKVRVTSRNVRTEYEIHNLY